MRNWFLMLLISFCFSTQVIAIEHEHGSKVVLDKAPIDLSDYASLQRGARIFMNECSGCHSLKYERYDSLAKGLEITDEDGKVLEKVVKDNLMFVGDKLASPINTAMRESDAANWFGIAPPDLTLVARYRGVDWLYTYLRSFYVDPNRPWGVNNLVYPDVAMPHVLLNLQGEQVLTDNGLKLVKKGSMSVAEYNSSVADLVNFLSFVGEPVQLIRHKIGAWVLVFLGIFLVFCYLLKREYWKDVH
jgi:ubiquinol-cytochrome c reductase cytochrome c1 subunit